MSKEGLVIFPLSGGFCQQFKYMYSISIQLPVKRKEGQEVTWCAIGDFLRFLFLKFSFSMYILAVFDSCNVHISILIKNLFDA